jgi:heavy metal sensor kinase
MSEPAPGRFRMIRTLRFRLASTFLLLLTIVLAVVGVVGTSTLKRVLEAQSEEELHEQIGALKGYFRFDEQGNWMWFVDHSDPEEEAAAGWVKTVFVIADEKGNALDGSPEPGLKPLSDRETILSELKQMQSTHQPVLKYFRGSDRITYQVLSTTMSDPAHGRTYYVAEGRSLAQDAVTVRAYKTRFLIFFPLALLVCSVVSWYSAGAALRALQSVEKAAQAITGSNLGLQIPKRGADDELDRLIDSFNEMSGRLKTSFAQIRQFSTDVSHELRTPLTAIQGQLEVALFTATRKEDLQEAIENALQDVERITNLVRALLLLSQSETGQIPVNKTCLDLGEIVKELAEQFEIPAEAGQLELRAVLPEAPVWCEADRTQIERVITNLLANAIKYTPPGGFVEACAEAVSDRVRVTVRDSGVGIPETHLPHIFDRFYRVPDVNWEKGLGLGLSFVASIVRAHGGEIEVRSEVGKGSCFEVLLPAGNVSIVAAEPSPAVV